MYTFTTTELIMLAVGISMFHIVIFAAMLTAKTLVDAQTTSTTSILGSLDLGRPDGDTSSGYRPSTTAPLEHLGVGRYGRVTPEPLPDPSNNQFDATIGMDKGLNPLIFGPYNVCLTKKDPETGASLAVELEITGCSDPQMWYAKLIGQRVPYIRQDIHTLDYWSREPAGYANIIRQKDAKVVRKGAAA